MKKTLLAGLWMVASAAMAGVPDSVYVRPTALPRGGGLMIEWSADGYRWTSATEGRVLGSDFGAWGAEKKLLSPSMTQGGDGQIACVFQVNDRTNQFGVTTTRDFIRWRPQDYPYMNGVGECLEPVVAYVQGIYTVTFHNKSNQYFRTTSRDLTHFSDPVATDTPNAPKTLRVPYTAIKHLRNKQLASQRKGELEGELARDNATRFAGLQDVQAEVRVSARNPKVISDKLMGIFFEDINYAADGGLNAQLVQNGDFEYDTHDRKGDVNWNSLTAWEKSNGLIVTATDGVSLNNSHAFAISGKGEYLANKGWDGIALKAGERYNLSMYVKDGAVKVTLVEGGKVVGETTVSGGKQWKLAKAVMRANANTKRAELRLQPVGLDCVSIDMVSLLPQDTYKGHGLRKDLAQALADLKPAFMRFPGGCVAHGDGIGNIYNWKETIGDLKDRKPARNLWGYHQSRQIGYYEFFQLCEDMGMEPLPVLAAGVPCQNSSDGAHGQQGGIRMEDMPDYIQDILDLIEWANGDASTKWGKKRAAQGHPKPFGLHYIGIGNEDLISPTFTERYLMICKAIKARYPHIKVCGTVGPFFEGSDYEEGWRIATENKDVIDMVDEHYYVSPGWFIYNHDYYDQYDRTAPKVYLGEWAAHGPGRQSTVETALSEALHFCALERNGDVVAMSSYAPLLAKHGHTQWNPDMIYFNNTEVFPTVCYQVQKMCGNSQGNLYLTSTITTQEGRHGVRERLGVSTVKDTKTGKTYLKLVNILPCEVKAHLVLDGVLKGQKNCRTIVLTGAFDSTEAKPYAQMQSFSPDCHYTMPAYSFTLIEL